MGKRSYREPLHPEVPALPPEISAVYSETMKRAWREGYSAFLYKRTLSGNPHPHQTDHRTGFWRDNRLHSAWTVGYAQAAHDRENAMSGRGA